MLKANDQDAIKSVSSNSALQQLQAAGEIYMDAIQAWRELLSSEHVRSDEQTIAAFQTATFATEQRVPAVILPGNTIEVRECVKIANRYRISLYPISCGKNWGLGSRVPVLSNSVVMDLSRLDRIVDYNEKLAYITVEPGVTFRQIHNYLCGINSNLFVSVIGGSPDASAIGNALERGDGSGPYGDRIGHACGFEVVLPTGDFIHTGFGRFANARTTPISRSGVGPAVDGLFAQSNLGIVTQMTLWLMPIPKYFQSFGFNVKDVTQLEPLLEIIQKLMLQGTIQENCFSLWNSYKTLARKGRYPWQLLKGKTPLSLQELKGIEPWGGNGGIYAASYEQALAERSIIEAAFGEHVDRLFFSEVTSESNNSTIGVPTDANVKSTYWRKKTNIPPTLDPDRDACGVLWLCPMLPFDEKQIVKALITIESIIKSDGFEPNLAMDCSSRSIRMFIAIMYDRSIKGEDGRAMDCHDRLMEFLLEAGYIPFRLGIQSMHSLPAARDDYGKLIADLKHALDPNYILSPGRYDFIHEGAVN
jgi:4-cresol dehydrogenase (hydroxylating) flavoprotein subunit